ncbi:MAG: hypothetical protein OXF75_14080 [Acidimicrobiaceae bacterium]|nr:hypothetical protein [Acidimicrobiaceae bacterium]
MLRPVIFIGCGGSGEKAVRYVRAAVQRCLDQADWQREMPDSWQFIGLDTLTAQENPTEIPTIPVNDFLTLSAEHNNYQALHRALVADHSGYRGAPGLLCGWLPDPGQVRLPIKDGAGQNRAIGRAAGLRSLERTLEPRLKEAFRRAKAGNNELYEVGQCLGVDAELGTETPQPLIVVCSSMAGGTGSGISLDVVDLLRRCDPLGRYPTLVLFANDIFNIYGQKNAMAANSLGLLSELLASYWSEPGEIETPLATNNVQDPGLGPHSIFVLSRAGYSGADLGDAAEFYRAVGQALSNWVTSSTVQENIHNFINVNWLNNAKENYGGYPLGKNSQFGAVSSFGAATVTVGRERFGEWARDLLSKQILETLLDGHKRLNPSAVDDQHLIDEELKSKLGERYAPMVFEAVPDWEPKPDRLPGLKGASDHFGSIAQTRSEAKRHERALKAQLPADQTASADQWLAELERWGRGAKDEIDRAALTRTPEDSEWCQEMVEATCRAASQVAAVSSLPVAAAALTEAAEKLNRAEADRIRREASRSGERYTDLVKEGQRMVKEIDGKIAADHSGIAGAARRIAQGIASYWQHKRLLQAADVCDNAEKQVLGAIADVLRQAAGQVGHACETDEFKAWPDNNNVPVKYRASSVEFPLESHDAWDANLNGLCTEAVDTRIAYGNRGTDPLRYRLVAGTDLLDEAIPPLVYPLSNTRWTPGQIASVTCDADTDEITERVQKWTSDPGSRFKTFLAEGLGAYLSGKDPTTDKVRVDQADRLRRFREQLGNAANRSEPLVSIDTDLYGECHENDLSFRTVCSGFPFSEQHPAEADAIKILGEQAYERSNADTGSVLVSQYINNPLHPLVLRSLTDPISAALEDTEDPGERSASFWMWRRARRLDGFVPLPRSVTASIIRGFAVARLCGYVTADASQPIRITSAAQEVKFPWPLLSRSKDPNDVLAVLIEGFSLTFGIVSGNGLGVYEGYKRLFDLGEPSEQGLLHPDLKQVLSSGSPPFPTVGDEQPKAAGADYGERSRAARNYLKGNEAWFLDQQTKRGGDEYFHRGSHGYAEPGVPSMELADLCCRCYSELHQMLESTGTERSVV